MACMYVTKKRQKVYLVYNLTASQSALLQECAYLCNMAVDPGHRRQGYGLLLLEAAEEIARLGGQRDLISPSQVRSSP